MGAIRYVGTSGWHYPHWQGVFYPPGLPPAAWLEYYARHFSTVEINSSFYRLPGPEAVRTWCDATPADFLFSVKASRFITHMKKLKDAPAALERLLPVLARLGTKCGPVLFQLPPRWGCNAARLAEFLQALPADLPCAFELRDPSWHRPEVYDLLARRNAAFCVYDIGGYRSPPMLTADFAYLRLHGPGAPYCGRYGTGALREWADLIGSWSGLRAVYAYFDNDQAGYAVADARELRTLLDGANQPRAGEAPTKR